MQTLKKVVLVLVYILFCMPLSFAQTFNPIPITGFTDDVIAETGTSSLTTTTNRLDGGSSNKVMYTVGFRTANSFGGGGIPDNGTITGASGNYQFAPYNGLNAAIIPRNSNRDITLITPQKYAALRVAILSTEGTSLINVTVHFSDGTSLTALSGASVTDWFNGTTNVLLQGFGRCTRATPASGADAFNSNPRLYFINIPISCGNQSKNITKINIANVTTAGNNAPFPNAVVFALSGVAATAVTATTSSTAASCTSLGTASINITAGISPFTVSWNTSPTQSGLTASNLTAGNYIATVTDANTCSFTFPVSVLQTSNITLSNRTDTSICNGASFIPNLISNATTFTWSPTTGVSNASVLNPTLNPTNTTTYTVTGTTGTICTINRSFTVTVRPPLQVNAGADKSIYTGTSTQLLGNGPSGTYLWTPATGLSATNILNPIASPTGNTTYTLRITTPEGCTGTDDVLITMIPYCVRTMNAFTPNGDAINDVWKIITGVNCTKQIKVSVYNRYGGLIYNNNNYQNNWDGTYAGKKVPDGTYYFNLEITLLNDQVIYQKGDVTILR